MITLSTLPTATAQEVFDQVVDHLLNQGAQCRSEDPWSTGCQYRNVSGLRCAAGSLIGAEEYREHFEDNSWATLVDMGYVPEEHVNLISKLQVIHDQFLPLVWPEMLMEVADEWGLQTKFNE